MYGYLDDGAGRFNSAAPLFDDLRNCLVQA